VNRSTAIICGNADLKLFGFICRVLAGHIPGFELSDKNTPTDL